MRKSKTWTWVHNVSAFLPILLVLTFIVYPPFLATAQEVSTPVSPGASPHITIPYGDWVAQIAEIVSALLVPVLLAVVSRLAYVLPAPITAAINTSRVEQLLDKAIGYAMNTVAGAAKGKSLDVNVGSQVVAEAVNYALQQGPSKLIVWLGGQDALIRMILARINLNQSADGKEAEALAAVRVDGSVITPDMKS